MKRQYLPVTVLLIAGTLAMIFVQALPGDWHQALRYEREAVRQGEWWRLLSGNFVHLGWRHLALNLAGLWLGTWAFAADRSALSWLAATLVCALATGVGLWWFSPTVGWCVGLSGALHGLMIVGFGAWALRGERLASGLLVLVVGKLLWEQSGGDMPWTDELVEGRVVTDAHLWGACGGALFLAMDALLQRWRRRGARV